MLRKLTFVMILALGGAITVADDWPTYRGPSRDGVSRELSTPAGWSVAERDNVRWVAPMPGGGDSGAVVVGDRLYVCAMSEDGSKRRTVALNRSSGAIVWTAECEVEKPGAVSVRMVSTPAADAAAVYAWHGSAAVAAYDAEDGHELWRVDPEPPELPDSPDAAPSPIIHGDLLINVSGTGGGGSPAVIALDRRTGERVWRADLSQVAAAGVARDEPLLASPIVIDNAGRPELIVLVPGWIVSLNPQSGREYWRCGGLGESVIASPATGAGLIVAISGGGGNTGGPMVAVAIPDAGHRGDITATHRRWRIETTPVIESAPVLVEPMLFTADMNGTLACRDIADGSVLWERALGDPGAPVRAPLIFVNQWVYATDAEGTVHIAEGRRRHHAIGGGSAAGKEATHAAPAFSDGQMFLRTDRAVYCIGVRVRP